MLPVVFILARRNLPVAFPNKFISETLGRVKVGAWPVGTGGNFISGHFSQRKNRLASLNVRIAKAKAVVLHILLGLHTAKLRQRKRHLALLNAKSTTRRTHILPRCSSSTSPFPSHEAPPLLFMLKPRKNSSTVERAKRAPTAAEPGPGDGPRIKTPTFL